MYHSKLDVIADSIFNLFLLKFFMNQGKTFFNRDTGDEGDETEEHKTRNGKHIQSF